MQALSVQQLISHYHLQPHPEGGYYKEIYRSVGIIPKAAMAKGFNGARNWSTAIYFLLEKGNFSGFHRIKSDECWHFYAGETLLIYVIQLNGSLQIIKLGSDILNGEIFQFVVPANCWFASIPAENSMYSFVGCTVAPGFDFEDFELAETKTLTKLYPQHKDIIKKLTR